MNPVTFKRRENEIEHAVEKVAKKSCKTAMLDVKCCHQKGCKININAKVSKFGFLDVPGVIIIIVIIIIRVIFIMLFLLYLVDFKNLVKEIYVKLN